MVPNSQGRLNAGRSACVSEMLMAIQTLELPGTRMQRIAMYLSGSQWRRHKNDTIASHKQVWHHALVGLQHKH